MSIVQTDKMTLYGAESQKASVIARLQELGCTQLVNLGEDTSPIIGCDERIQLHRAIGDMEEWGEFWLPPDGQIRDVSLWFYVVPIRNVEHLVELPSPRIKASRETSARLEEIPGEVAFPFAVGDTQDAHFDCSVCGGAVVELRSYGRRAVSDDA
jgi:hypothetical protein